MKIQEEKRTTIPSSAYIRRLQLTQQLCIHVTTLDHWHRDKHHPSFVKLGENITAFDAVEINNWLAARRGAA